MSMIESLTYPKTNFVPTIGGSVRIGFTTNIDTSYNDDFVTTYDATVWTEDGSNANVTLTAGTGTSPLTLAVNGAAGAAQYYLNGDNAVTGPLAVSWGFKIDDKGNTTNGVNKVVLRAQKPGDNENIVLAYEFDETNSIERLSLTYRDVNGAGDTTVTKDFVDRDCFLRLVMANGRLAVFDEKNPQSVIFDVPYVLDWSPEFDIGVEAPSNAANVWDMIPKKFTWLPTMSGILDKRATHMPWCIGFNKNESTWYLIPGHEGTMTVSIKGTGTGDATVQSIGDIVSIVANHRDQGYKFLASNVEQFYDDAADYLICRTQALRDEANNGDNIISMVCVDDGTAQDGTKDYLKVIRSGDLDKFNKFPQFAIEDSNGVDYGESFRFDRILHDEGTDLSVDPADSTGDRIRYMRCLEMSNGDRCYYGVTFDPTYATTVGSLPDTGTIFQATGTNLDTWNLYSIDSSGTESSVANDAFDGTADELFALPSLSTGKYILRGGSGALFSGTIYADSSAGDRIETTVTNSQQSDLVNELYFEIVDPVGKLVIFYHDVSANTVTKYLRGTADVSNRRYNLSAVETSDGKVAVIYEDGTISDVATYENYSDRKLTYRKFNPGTGWEANTYTIELPSEIPNNVLFVEGQPGYQVHAFDFVDTGNRYEIIFSARYHCDNYYARDVNGNIPWKIDYDAETGTFASGEFLDFGGGGFAKGIHLVDNGTTGTLYFHMITGALPLDNESVSEPFANGAATTNGGPSLAEETVLRQPYIENQVYVVSVDKGYIDFADKDFILSQFEINTFSRPSHTVAFEYRDPDAADFLANLARSEVDFVSANYDKDKGLTVVSTLDMRHRCPVVHMGIRDSFSEICLPFHFDSTNFFFKNQDGAATPFSYFGIETYDAVLGYDSFIYGFAVKPDDVNFNIEMGIIDPNIYFDDRSQYLQRGPEYFSTNTEVFERFDIYRGDYGYEAVPIANLYGDTAGFSTLSAVRINQYNVLSLGGPFSFLTVLQNNEYDQFPFQTSEEEVWFPEYGENTTAEWDDGAGGGVTFNRQYADIPERDSTGAARYQFGKNLQLKVPSHYPIRRDRMADVGYKIHARVQFGQTVGGVMTNMPTRDMLLSCAMYWDIDGVAANNDQYRILARFVASGSDLLCQIYDPGTTNYVTVHTFTSYLAAPEIVDYFILGRIVTDVTNYKARVSFVYKRRSQNIEDQASDFYYSDYTTTVDLHKDFAEAESLTSNISTNFLVEGATYNSVAAEADDNNRAWVYQMGWNGLDAPSGVYHEDPKGPTEGFSTYLGPSWRKMNDGFLLTKDVDDGLEYGFKSSKIFNRDPATVSFHWPNGFEYRVSGLSMKINDRWELSREPVDVLSYLESDKLHGIWYSSSDDSDIYIWADAEDSDLGKFNVNTYMVLGSNMPEVTLVGKDTIGGAWVEIDTMDLKTHVVDVASHNHTTTKDVIVLNNADLLNKDLKQITSYFQQPGEKAHLLTDTQGATLYTQLNAALTTPPTGISEIFADRGIKTLPQSHRYRYVGIKIPAADTYEGYFKLHTLDFGTYTEVPLDQNHSIGSGKSMSVKSDMYYVFDNQPTAVLKHRIIPEFTFDYKIFDALTAAKWKAIVSKVGFNRRPLWVFNEFEGDRTEIYLCIVTNAMDHGIVIDEDGEKYYRMTITLRSVS